MRMVSMPILLMASAVMPQMLPCNCFVDGKLCLYTEI